jgi:phage terminase small subunit
MAAAAEEKRRKFARALACGATATEAAVIAGYKRSHALASKLSRHPAVQAELARMNAQADAAAIAERREVLELLTAQLRFSLEEVVRIGPKGHVAIDLSRAQAAHRLHLLAGLRVRNVEGGVEVNVKTHDKLGITDRLCRMCGWAAADRIEHSGRLDIGEGVLTEAEKIELIADELEGLERTPKGRAALAALEAKMAEKKT